MNKKANKNKANSSKKKLIRTQSEINRTRIIVTVVLLAIAALVYFFIDSSRYVATVDGHRISKVEYNYFLQQQMAATENEEGLSTQEAKDTFWSTPADGQDPYETAKREALNNTKSFMIQYIKAQESGLMVTPEIENEVASLLANYQGSLTDKQFEEQYRIKKEDLQALYEKFSLIEDYSSKYIGEEFTAPEFTDQEIRAEYEDNRPSYDKVDLTYVTFYKFDEEGAPISEEESAIKLVKADEVLAKILKGENMDKLVEEYSEENIQENQASSPSRTMGKATVSLNQNSSYEYNMDRELIQWAFDNKIDDVKIIETDYFIYVARIDGRTDLEDVKETVKAAMTYMAGDEFYTKALDNWGLESKYNIIKNDRVYDSISYK